MPLTFQKDYNVLIGKLLLQKNIITESQLTRALDFQNEKLHKEGKAVYVGMVIVELGFTTEEEIIEAVNEHFGLKVTSLSENIEQLIRKKRASFLERISSPRIPIWVQLSVAIVCIIIITISSLSYLILAKQKAELNRQTLKIGMVSLNYFTNNARIPLIRDNILQLNTLIKEAAEVDGIVYAIIVDQHGKIQAHTDLNRIGEPFKKAADIKIISKKNGTTYFNDETPAGENIINLTRPIMFKEKLLGTAHVGVSIDFIRELIYEKRLFIIVFAAGIIFIGVIISVFLGFRFSKPVSKLVVATQEIGRGNYQHKVDLQRNDELGNLALAFNRMSRELWMKSQMQRSFGKYVGSQVLEMIMANPERSWLKGQRQNATILFTDIRGFTSFSENNEPEKIVEGLNEYFEIASNVILCHGGYIDKFIGDAVLAVFGVPVFHENHMERALRAALAMQEDFKKASKGKRRFLSSIGISINSGVVVSGNIGSQFKMEYTVIGDSVNVASRMNGFAGPGEIIISKGIYEDLEDILEASPMPPQEVKGKSEPLQSYKLLGIKDE